MSGFETAWFVVVRVLRAALGMVGKIDDEDISKDFVNRETFRGQLVPVPLLCCLFFLMNIQRSNE